MFNKTSSIEFLKYGEVYTNYTRERNSYTSNYTLTIQNDSLIYFYYASNDVYIQVTSGICMLVVTDDLNSDAFDEFVIHRIVKINKGVYFNFVTLGNQAKVSMAFPADTVVQNKFFEKAYTYERIKPRIRIDELLAYYYSVRGPNYRSIPEDDYHWEFTIVDNGCVHTSVDGEEYVINANEMMIYGPGQYHVQKTENETASYLTIMIDMNLDEKYASQLINRVFSIDRESRSSVESFVRYNDSHSDFGQDLMILALEGIIINLLKGDETPPHKIASTPMQQKFENELLNEILLYINENIYTSFNVEELCQHFAISRSSLQSLFRNNLGIAPKEYISNLKLEKSKLLIKDSKYTISDIASMLGFSSIHYFSRKFKQEYGINPTDYANKMLK